MNDYRDLTVITTTPGRWEKGGNWVPGTETQSTVCGCNAPGGLTRNRNETGTNESDPMKFYLFTDTWDSERVILDNGIRYTTQSYSVWPKFVEVSALLESP